MITARDDYLDLLYRIQDPNKQTTAIKLPKDEPLCKVDLNNRVITVPDEIKVIEFDHNSETLYFSVDRYFDSVDLSTLYAVVQYNNANPDKTKNGFIYAVPYFDITTLPAEGQEGKMLFQWAIEGPATAYAGKVTFSIKFYRISEYDDVDKHGTPIKVKSFDYVLNTMPAELKILPGMNTTKVNENYIYDDDTVLEIYQRIEEISRSQHLYWLVMENVDDSIPIPTDNNYPIGTVDKTEEIEENITLRKNKGI